MTGREDDATLATLLQGVARMLNVDAVDPDVAFPELGIDSLNAVELTLICDELYPLVDPEKLTIGQYTTLRDLDRQLRQMSLEAGDDPLADRGAVVEAVPPHGDGRRQPEA